MSDTYIAQNTTSETQTSNTLIDSFGRNITYVRMSVTDRCNLRCIYCMTEDMTFLPRKEILSLEEIRIIAHSLEQLGINKIRLTGGEPLVRNNIMWLVEKLSELRNIRTIALTTNGVLLPNYACELQKYGVSRINISIDSLQPDKFRQLTRFGKLSQVLKGIRAAKDAGIQSIRLNAVILKGYNDDEIVNLVDFARDMCIDIAFIEEMPLGNVGRNRQSESITNTELLQKLQRHFTLLPSTMHTGGPARYYQCADNSTHVGFISPHSHNFCGDCNRIRITAEGRLLLCLGNEHSIDLRHQLRQHPTKQIEQHIAAIKKSILLGIHKKPERHYFYNDNTPQILRFMNATGG